MKEVTWNVSFQQQHNVQVNAMDLSMRTMLNHFTKMGYVVTKENGTVDASLNQVIILCIFGRNNE